jgi:cytochrome c biogenesis protein CcmG/thiol:disulfide interchange protein DsbE
LRGKVVYVDFWASWCAPCRVSFPILDALGAKHGAQGFAVVGVNQDDAAKDRDAFMKRVRVKFTLVEDGDHKIAKAYDVKAMPSGYLIDRKGTVRYVHAGFDGSSRDKLETQILQLLKETP